MIVLEWNYSTKDHLVQYLVWTKTDDTDGGLSTLVSSTLYFLFLIF